DEAETSMMMVLAPEIVNMAKAKKDFAPGPGYLTRVPGKKGTVYSPTGAWGDPTLATLEKGHKIVDARVKTIVREVEALMKRVGRK
ncbi:MAG TPA: creatininase family protein, partial [Bdellovibrionota bacterium]|nr:creatininase family protein [Bdellovibrionota bacterium]